MCVMFMTVINDEQTTFIHRSAGTAAGRFVVARQAQPYADIFLTPGALM